MMLRRRASIGDIAFIERNLPIICQIMETLRNAYFFLPFFSKKSKTSKYIYKNVENEKNFVYSRLCIQLLLWLYEPSNMDLKCLNFEADSDHVIEV